MEDYEVKWSANFNFHHEGWDINLFMRLNREVPLETAQGFADDIRKGLINRHATLLEEGLKNGETATANFETADGLKMSGIVTWNQKTSYRPFTNHKVTNDN